MKRAPVDTPDPVGYRVMLEAAEKISHRIRSVIVQEPRRLRLLALVHALCTVSQRAGATRDEVLSHVVGCWQSMEPRTAQKEGRHGV